MDYLEKRANLHYFCRNNKAHKTLKIFHEENFWSIMKNETMHAHLEAEAHKVADLIASEWGNRRTSE